MGDIMVSCPGGHITSIKAQEYSVYPLEAGERKEGDEEVCTVQSADVSNGVLDHLEEEKDIFHTSIMHILTDCYT